MSWIFSKMNVKGSLESHFVDSSTSTCSSFDKVKYYELRLPYNKMFWVFQKGPKDIFSA